MSCQVELSSMQLCDESTTLEGTINNVWNFLVDWRSMPSWDIFMESLDFDGPLEKGSLGRLKMKNGPTAPLLVTAFNPPHSYTDELRFWFTRLIFHHELKEIQPGKVSVRFIVEGEGLLPALIGSWMKKDMHEKMPLLLSNFKEQFGKLHQKPEF